MKVLKLGIISFIVFALLFTGISLFFPSHIRISKAIDINTGKEAVLNQLNNPRNWKTWYPGTDSSSYLMVNGVIKGIQTGDQQGIMISGTTDSSILTINVGPHSKKGTSGWIIYDGGLPNTYTVQWYMDFRLRWYPWEKFSSLLLEKRYGPMMEKGLANLKARLEQ